MMPPKTKSLETAAAAPPYLSEVPAVKATSHIAINARIREITAFRMEGMPIDERLARILQLPSEAARELASGHKAFTLDMVQFIADRYGVTIGWLASGTGPMTDTEASESEAASFVKKRRSCGPLQKACLDFAVGMLNPRGFLELLAEEDRADVVASVRQLLERDSELDDLLPDIRRLVLPKVRERYDLDEYAVEPDREVITPLHALLGITGPRNLAQLLSTQP